MNRWVLPSRRLVFVCSVIFLSFLVLNLPLLAAGPAPVQNGPSGPRIWLQENQPLPVQHIPVALGNGPGMAVADSSALSGMGQGQPVAMASADLDADGFDDLLVGYSTGAGGFISIHRGNIDAFAPQSDASFQAIGRGQFPSPFLLEARTFSVPVSPDFIAVGDFTGNGNRDLAVASKGGSALYIFPGDGKGNFAAPQTVNLAGGVTSLAAGELGHTPVLIVGTSRSLAVYVYSPQGLTALASYPLAAPASNVLFGDFGDPGPDVAFLSGGKIQILRSSTMQVATVSLPVTVQAFALGTFIYDRSYGQQIALVAPDGSIKFAVRNEFDPRVYSVEEFQAIRQAKMNRQPAPAFVPVPSFPANGWKIVESFPGAAALGANQAPLIFRTRISINGADDVMVLNAFSGQLSLVSHGDGQPGAQTFQSGQVSLRPYSGTPIAALPMRLNVDGRLGVMAIHSNEVAPSLMVPIPDPTFFVNKDTDTAPTSPIANACNNTSFADVSSSCSLREAVLKANGDTIMLQAGHTYSLTIGRGATQDYTGNTGALYMNHTATIVGGNQSTTVIQWGTPGTGTADMVMAVNEDVSIISSATGSLSNLTIQNGVNHGASGLDGDGGCMEFDTGTNGTATLSLTNVTLQNCSTLQGGGGGIVIFNFVTPAGAGGVTISNSIIQGNSVVNTGSAGLGGGIAINFDAHMTMTASQVKNNSAVQNCTPTCGLGAGGGIIGFAPQNVSAATGESFIHSSTISGNQAAGFGGGINTSASISIDQGTVISGNTAGTDGSNPTAHASQEGGGLYLNPAASCPLSSTCTATLGKLTITGNKATGNGGGISYGNLTAGTVGALSMSFSRLAGNTTSGGSGSNLSNNHGTATVTDNWWGTNNATSTINSISATTTFDPFIVLTHTGNQQKIRINQSSTLTGDMSADNHGTAVGLANLTEIIGLPITFDSPVLGTIPQAQPEALNANAQATATFNAGGTSGFGTANATVDQAVVPVNSNLISSATETGTTATITTVGAHGYAANEFVRISGVGVAGYNSSPATQVFTILTTPTPTTFTYTANAAGLGSSSGGTANAGIVILEPPSIAKKFSPATIQTTAGAGTTVSTITFTIQNQNVVPIDASFTDNLPTNVGVSPGSLVVATTPTVVNNCGGSVTATAGAGSISFSNTTLPVGTCTIQVNVQSAVDNIYSNSVTIDSTDAGNGNTSSDTLNVINPPHIVKSFGAATIPLNGTTSLTFTISSTNQNQTLSGISFTDSLPAGLVVATPGNPTTTCTGTPTAVDGSSSVALSTSSLAPGASCTVSVTVQGTTAGVKSNSVTVSDATAGTGNTGTANLTVVAPPTISKAFNPSASIPLNGITTITFTISNPNTTAAGDLTGVSFSDTLPSATGTLVVAPTPNVSNTCNGTVTATAGTGIISLSGGTVTHNASCTLSVDVKGTAAGNADNTTGAITSTQGGTGTTSNTAPMTVVAPPTITKAFGATSVPLNGTTTVTFTITNPAANTTAELGVAFSDTLTSGLQVASTPGVSNTCGGTVTAAANTTTISLSGGSVTTPGASCTIVVNVTGTQSGNNIPNTTGAVSSTNGGTGATSNTATLTVASPPTINKAFGATTIPLNGTTSVSFIINNPNSNVTLNGVAFTDNLPAGLVVAPTPNVSNTCSGSVTAVAGSSLISLSSGVVSQAASCTLSVDVQGTTAGAKLNTTGAITSTEGGTGTASNTATLTVVAPPTISKTFNPSASIPLNGITTATFNITNANTTAAGDLTGVSFSDTLPSATGTLVVAPTPNVSNTCNGTVTATAGTGIISLSGGTVAHNTSCTVSVDVKGTVAGNANNTTGAITSTQGGTGTTSNTAPMTVVAPPTISKAFGAANISLNGTTTVTFTITNPAANTSAENGVAFSDTLTNGLQVASTPGVSNTCGGTVTATANSTSISLSGGSVTTPGTSCTIVVNVTGTQSGTVSNTTGAVSSTNGGTGATSNTATLTVASPPTINKTFNPTTIPVAGSSTLTFNLTNPNNNVALTGIAFTDNLPSGVVVASTPGGTNTCAGTFAPGAGASSFSLSGGTLPASGTCTLSVNVTGTTAGTKLNTTTAITSTEGGTGNPSNTATLTVNPATTSTTVASSLNPSVFGQSVTFTATVTDTSAGSIAQPTGSVQFVVDGVNFGSPVALTGASSTSSTASQATATLSVTGSPHSVTANYVNADGNFTNSTGSLTPGQTVTAASTATAVISSSNPSVVGQPVTFTATVTDTSAGSTAQPTGSVQFVVDGVNFGSPVTLVGAGSTSSAATSAATATLSVAGSPHSVTAIYVNADGNFSNSTGALIGGQVVNKPSTTTTVTPSLGTITLGDTVTFTATVTVNPPGSGTPTGIVTFFDGTRPIASGLLNNGSPDQATFSTSVLAVGSHSITAIYNGDANFTASPLSSPSAETVNLRASTTSVVLNPTTVGAGQASTITATITDAGASTPPGTADTFSPTGAPATGRTGFTATLFADGAVVVIGGTDANNVVLNSAEVYTVSGGTFTPTPGNLNIARTGAVAVLLSNGKVLVAGGSSNGAASGALNSAELLDLKTGTFAPTSQNMTSARFGTTATLLNNGKVLVAGGSNSGGVLNSAELYDPAADTFTATGNLNAARTGASATLLGSGKVLVAGGSSDGTANGALNSAEVFDPAGNAGAGTFISVAGANPTLSSGRWQPEAALLLSGKVLVAGGQNSGVPQTTADIYDPVADSFTASAHQMNEARANGSAVALPSGMVLLPGGTTSQAVDLYDADNDTFNPTGSLQHHDTGLVSTLLNNGQVLVVGLSDAPASDAELYSPSFNPLGTVGFNSSDVTDVFGTPCVLTPSTSTASTCTSTVTPAHVGTNPHTITGAYPADAVHSGSSNSASLTVIPTAPPTIAKAFSAARAGQNSTIGVSFTIVNPNPGATLTGISFTDALPAGLVVATPNNLSSNCGGTVTAVAGSSALSLTGGTVAPAGTPPAIGQCVVTVSLLVTGTGTLSNTTGPVSANESGPGNPSNTATLQVVLAPTAAKAFGAASIPLSGTTSLTFNVANPNASTTLVSIALSDTLPNGLVVASPNGLTGTCVSTFGASVAATPGSNSISLSLLNLPGAGSCSLSVNVTGTSGGAKINTTAPITATFDDGSGTFIPINGGSASASVVVVAPPSIAKAFVPAAIAPSGVSTLSFTITNPAANTVAENGVAFTDTLPANVVVATPNGAVGNCNGGTLTAVAGSGSISLAGGSVAAASACVVSVNVTSATPGSYTNISGAVSSTNGGTGNTATAVLTVQHASLSITKSHVGNFPRKSTGNNYTITVSNSASAGPTVGTVTVTDTLPNVNNTLVATGLTGTGWTCNLGTLTCTRSDALAPGASYPAITLTVTVPQNIQANVTNSATVSGGGDPNSHTANDPTHIGPPIEVTLAINNVTVNVGATQFVNFTVDSAPGEGTINFACTGLPFGATCSFNPPSTNQLSATVTMGITTSPGAGSVLPLGTGRTPPLYAAVLPLLGLMIGFGLRKKGKLARMRLAFAFSGLALFLALMGCGGTRTTPPTPPSTSQVTVTAISATTGDSGSATITLTVP